jgi:hypothetical protein
MTCKWSLKLLPIGVAPVGAWRYAFIYELSHRHFPQLIEQASHIYESEARQQLARLFFASVGAAPASAITHLFGWKKEIVEKTLLPLFSSGQLTTAVYPGEANPRIGLPQLIDSASIEKE